MEKSSKKPKFKATPVRLNEFKAPLQEEAQKLDRSMNWLILSAVKQLPCIQDFIKNKK